MVASSSSIKFCIGFTVTDDVAVLPPSTVVAEIVHTPGATAVSVPLVLTVAIAGLDELHVTFLFVQLVGVMIAFIAWVAPAFKEKVVGSTVTAITGTITDKLQLLTFPPSSVVAVIATFPAATAVTTPVGLTVAILLFADLQVTFLLVAVEGATSALS